MALESASNVAYVFSDICPTMVERFNETCVADSRTNDVFGNMSDTIVKTASIVKGEVDPSEGVDQFELCLRQKGPSALESGPMTLRTRPAASGRLPRMDFFHAVDSFAGLYEQSRFPGRCRALSAPNRLSPAVFAVATAIPGLDMPIPSDEQP